jgi:hypothetical protein
MRTFDIECPEMEKILRDGAPMADGYRQSFVSGAELFEKER